jgi:hypothetical protein
MAAGGSASRATKAKKRAGSGEPRLIPLRSIMVDEGEASVRDHEDRATVTPQGSSLFMVRVGGREYPLRTDAICRVCQHPQRDLIEDLIVEGRATLAVNAALGIGRGEEGWVSWDSIRGHRIKHMPPDRVFRAAMQADHAEHMGQNLDEIGTVLTPAGVVAEVIQHGFMELLAGRLEIKAGDLMRAVGLQVQMQAEAGVNFDSEAYLDVIRAHMETTMALLPPERQAEYSMRLESHPLMRAIAEKVSPHGQFHPDAIPVEAWDNEWDDDD